MASLFEGLQNIPVFEGRSEEDRRSALLQAGLALMQPPQLGGGPVAQVGGGIQAGLTDLDKTKAANAAADQQVFQNLITTQGAEADTTRAEAVALTAETGKGRLAQEVDEFSVEDGLRKAKINLDKAQAAWLKRRWSGPPAGASKAVTAAMLEDKVIQAQIVNLIRADPAKYTLENGDINYQLATVQAFNDLHKAKGLAGSDTLGFILDKGEAEVTGQTISTLQGTPPVPASVVSNTKPTPQTQQEIDALTPGTQFTWTDGKSYTRQ